MPLWMNGWKMQPALKVQEIAPLSGMCDPSETLAAPSL